MRYFNKCWKPWKSTPEKGQTLVEFALVMGFIIIPLTFVLIEASVLLYQYVALTNAAREGARTGSIYLYVGDPGNSPALPDAGRGAAVLTTVSGTMGPLIPPPSDCNGSGADTTCQITYGPPSAPPPISDPLRSTDSMTVTITYTHPVLFGALGSTLELNARASMKIEPSSVISPTGP
jgi:Flp pilus assembly protein TadG